MADYRDYVGGSYLKAEDWAGRPPIRLRIESVKPEQIKSETGTDTKLVARFVNKEKGLSLNKTNMEVMALLSNTTDYEKWVGMVVEMYHDPTVKMGTRTTGGLRLRETAGSRRPIDIPTQPPTSPTPTEAPPTEAPPTPAAEVYDDDVPF